MQLNKLCVKIDWNGVDIMDIVNEQLIIRKDRPIEKIMKYTKLSKEEILKIEI